MHALCSYAGGVRAALLSIAACGAAAPARQPAPVIAKVTRTCAEAAAGLERSTVSVRAPEHSIIQPMREHCVTDAIASRSSDAKKKVAEANAAIARLVRS